MSSAGTPEISDAFSGVKSLMIALRASKFSGPLGDELLVGQALGQDDVHHSVDNGDVRARTLAEDR